MESNNPNSHTITALPCNSSSSGNCTCGLANHPGGNANNGKGGQSLPPPPPPPLNLCIVINICHYLTPLAKLIILAQPLENSSGEAERDAFLALQQILTVLDSGKNEPINVFPFFDKFCRYIGTTFSDFEEMDIFLVWDYLVKLITLVIPPLREIFMGRLSLSLDEHAWHSLTTRCIHAQFTQSVQSLEDFIRLTMHQYDKDYYNDLDLYQYSQQHSNLNNHPHGGNPSTNSTNPPHRTSIESIKNFNSIILGRSPEILAFAIESAHLPSSLRFLDALNKNPSKGKSPNNIKFPASFNLSTLRDQKNTHAASAASKDAKDAITGHVSADDELSSSNNIYDLAAVVTLEGSNCDIAQAYYRYVHEENNHLQWFKGSGATHDLVDASKAIEKNYFSSSDSRKVHPRLLIYAKRGISVILDQLKDFVTKGGQLRSKGDATFATAETPEHYDEAKQYYEEAIAHDASLRSVLQERLNSLEQIEKNQKAQSYENQADLSLGKRRFKEACDLYKLAMRSAVVNSPTYNRIREKEDYMMRIISLEIANHLTEKGEECLKSGSYTQSRENFAQALKLNPNYIHLQSIIQGIDRLITQQTSAQKVSEANQAMKIGRYKYANQLFQEAVALVPEREAALKPVLDSLIVLMQGEDALMKQRSGLIALEDKKYPQAISLITEAITLLPPESITEHAFFLCDRAQVYFEMKEYQTSIADCLAALELRPELAIAYLRLGSAQFELEHYDEALASYEKAMRNDPSLADQVKTKIRQVNTAKEVQQRKEREAERARVREEEMKRLEEKRARDEKLKKEKLEKQREEQAEKAERTLMKEEEKRIRLVENRPEVTVAPGGKDGDSKSKHTNSKESLKERQKREKAEKEALKLQEKEKQRVEKEKERERLKAERELKLREEQLAKEEEIRRHREFAAEIEKAEAKLKEAEREKELEREKARLEREKLLAEREKAKQEKKVQQEANKKAKATSNNNAKDQQSSNDTVTPVAPKSAAAVVASGATPRSNQVTNADPDFPSLGSSAVSNVSQSKKTENPVSTASNKQKGNVNNTPVITTKWASLVASSTVSSSTNTNTNEEQSNNKEHEEPSTAAVQIKKRNNSVPSNNGNNNNNAPVAPASAKKSSAAAPPAPSNEYVDHFPTLATPTTNSDASSLQSRYGGGSAGGVGYLDYSSSAVPSEPVLSSGELKALISKTINDIPAIQLPQSVRSTSEFSQEGFNGSQHSLYNNSGIPLTQSNISAYAEDPMRSLLNPTPPNANNIPPRGAEKPPGISPFSQNSVNNNPGYNPHFLSTSSSILTSPAHLSIGLLPGESNDVSNLLTNQISRASSKTFDSLYVAPPAPSEAERQLSFSLPSLDESSLLFDNFSNPGNVNAGGSAFGRAGLVGLGATSGDEASAVNMRTSSRLTSLFGKSSELGGVGEHSLLSGGSGLGVTGFGGISAPSALLGDSMGGGGSKDSLLGVSGSGYSIDNYSLNYSFDNHGIGALTQPNLGPVTSSGLTSHLGDLGGIGLSGALDSGDSLFGALSGSVTNTAAEDSRLSKLFSGLTSNLDLSNDIAGAKTTSSLFAGLDSGGANSTSFSFLSSPNDNTSSLLGADSSLGFWGASDRTSLAASSAGVIGNAFGLSSTNVFDVSSVMSVKKYHLSDLGKRLDDVVVRDYVTFSALPALQKLCSAQLFHWATDGKEWLEYALFLPSNVVNVIQLGGLQSLAHSCRCEVVAKEVLLNGQKETVFVISVASNASVSAASAINLLLEALYRRVQQHATTLAAVTTLTSSPSSVPATAAMMSSSQLSGSPSTTTSNSAQSTVAPSNDNRWGSKTQGSNVSANSKGSNDFTIADSVIDSLIAQTVVTEKDLLSSPSSISSNGAGNVTASSTTMLPPSSVSSASAVPSAITSSPSITKKGVTAAAVVAKGGAAIPSLARPAVTAKPATNTSAPSTPSTSTPSASATAALPAGQIRRFLEIPSELIGLVIGHQGRKIKELATESGSKIQFRTSKTSEKEGKPGVLEIHGVADSVDKAVMMVSELLHSVGKEFREVNAQQAKAIQR